MSLGLVVDFANAGGSLNWCFTAEIPESYQYSHHVALFLHVLIMGNYTENLILSLASGAYIANVAYNSSSSVFIDGWLLPESPLGYSWGWSVPNVFLAALNPVEHDR